MGRTCASVPAARGLRQGSASRAPTRSTSAAARGRTTRSWSRGWGRRPSPGRTRRRRSSRRCESACQGSNPCRRPRRRCRSRTTVRRGARAARRALHEGPGCGRGGDGAASPGPGGVVAACVWDLAGDRTPLSVLRRAARASSDPSACDEVRPARRAPGSAVGVLRAAGLTPDRTDADEAPLSRLTFEEWLDPVLARRRARRPSTSPRSTTSAVWPCASAAREILLDALPAVAWVARGLVD